VSRQSRPTRQQRRAATHNAASPSFWRGPLPIIGVVAGLVLIIVVFIVISRIQHSSVPTTAADQRVIDKLTHVSSSVSDGVGTGGQANPLTRTSAVTVLVGADGKPEVLYMGAEWCPYCAAERWAMVVALSRFGGFRNLSFTNSSSGDVFPDTRTLSFHGSSYTSTYLDFVAVELQDRAGNTLDRPTVAQDQLMRTYDSDRSIPFLDIANRYTAVGRGVLPDVLQGLSWQQIANALSNTDAPVTRAIVGNANYLTAGICKLSGPNSAPICANATIKQIASQLP
jgi:thiol-disulfide isomerase/thioredoxin